jgi:V-type H+-transporting ATPase subunit d
MELMTFNIENGFLEGIVRGQKDAVLTSAQYMNLTQCETLDGASPPPLPTDGSHDTADLKLQLSGTDFGPFFQNEPSPLATSTIAARCTEKLIQDFEYLRASAAQPLAKFLDYITCVYGVKYQRY